MHSLLKSGGERQLVVADLCLESLRASLAVNIYRVVAVAAVRGRRLLNADSDADLALALGGELYPRSRPVTGDPALCLFRASDDLDLVYDREYIDRLCIGNIELVEL